MTFSSHANVTCKISAQVSSSYNSWQIFDSPSPHEPHLGELHSVAYLSSFPGLPCFCSLASVKHGNRGVVKNNALLLPCITLNTKLRTKNGGGLGTRLGRLPSSSSCYWLWVFTTQCPLESSLSSPPVVGCSPLEKRSKSLPRKLTQDMTSLWAMLSCR